MDGWMANCALTFAEISGFSGLGWAGQDDLAAFWTLHEYRLGIARALHHHRTVQGVVVEGMSPGRTAWTKRA
jgi:hypothetical protein